MKKYFFVLCIILFVIGLLFLWICYLEFMLFPPKMLSAQKEVVVEQVMPASTPAKKPDKHIKKNKTTSRLAHPVRSDRKKVGKPAEQAISGYPWSKLQDTDVLLALAVVSLLSFAAGVSYFQLGWKKQL